MNNLAAFENDLRIWEEIKGDPCVERCLNAKLPNSGHVVDWNKATEGSRRFAENHYPILKEILG